MSNGIVSLINYQLGVNMNNNRIMDEIREVNLTYLMLAQQLIRLDRTEALFRLGLSEDIANILESLSAAQLLKIAGSNMVLARFRFDDGMVWGLLTNHGQEHPKSDSAAGKIHAAIVMASRTAEVV